MPRAMYYNCVAKQNSIHTCTLAMPELHSTPSGVPCLCIILVLVSFTAHITHNTVVPLVSLVHECPVSTHYPFACSACLWFSEYNSTQTAASQECQVQGGALLTVSEELEWEMLQLYLESLNLTTTRVWLGYRYIICQINCRFALQCDLF